MVPASFFELNPAPQHYLPHGCFLTVPEPNHTRQSLRFSSLFGVPSFLCENMALTWISLKAQPCLRRPSRWLWPWSTARC